MTYRVLVLPEDADQLTVPVLQKIRDLIAEGTVVIAPRPTMSPSLMGYPASDKQIQAIADEVWGAIDGKSVTKHNYGKGRVYWGKSVEDGNLTVPDTAVASPGVRQKLEMKGVKVMAVPQ